MIRRLKVMTIFGTRPEAVKLGPVIKELEKNVQYFESVVCITAQHREMLDQVLRVMNIKVDYDLDVMKNNQTLNEITIQVLLGLDKVISNEKPDIVLVHGDTLTTFIASFCAFLNRVKVGHVEAGLRTWDKNSPFPEEVNRQLVGVMADIHFCPTLLAASNLLKENKNERDIFVTGNTALDVFPYTIIPEFEHPVISWANGRKLILMSAHRRESQGEPHRNIFRAIRRIADEFKEVAIAYPVHLSPAVQTPAFEILDGHPNIKLIKPMDVFEWQNLYPFAHIVVTDSGGVQEEAPAFNLPTLVIRESTERPEGVQTGALKVVGTEEEEVYQQIKMLLTNQDEYERMAQAENPYGDGLASERIIEGLKYYFDFSNNKPEPFKYKSGSILVK